MATESISQLAGQTGARGVAAALRKAGEATGAGFEVLYNMARRESALDPSAKAKTSSAAGLFQFIEQTWLGAVKNYGAKHGLADAAASITRNASGRFAVADADQRQAILNLRFDPERAAALAGELTQENRASLENKLGREVNAAELYAAHFLGASGAVKLLTAAPDANAAALLPKASAANRPVFYDGARARTVSEVMASIGRSMGAEAPAGDWPALETKGFALATAGPAARAIIGAGAPAPERLAPARTASVATEVGLPRSFALGPVPLPKMLSPLALAILQALDPAQLGADRDETRASRS